jgi:hypothetical protein
MHVIVACVSGGSGGMERIFNQGHPCSSVRKQSYVHMLEYVTHGWRWMRGPGGNDDVEGYGLRKITNGVLLYKSIG